jgi:hypothetical protein
MKTQEFDYICIIYDRLHKISSLFYTNSSMSEGHYELGKLMEYVENIYHETNEVEK